jgi:hypothetical protein
LRARIVDQQSEDFKVFDIPIASHVNPVVDSPTYSVNELLDLDTPISKMLIKDVVSEAGASLIVGSPKSGKTLLAVQIAISVASGVPFCGEFPVYTPGAALIVEYDDPAGVGSIKDIVAASRVKVRDIPLYTRAKVPYELGPDFISWLGDEIARLSLRVVVLDSYTSLRGTRVKGGDVVKAEQIDMKALDALGKRLRCAILVIHHGSKAASGLDWTMNAAGSFAMIAATDSQIHVSRYPDLEMNATERLIRIRGRHSADLEMVLRFCPPTLDYDYVMRGGASLFYPTMVDLQRAFGSRPFSPAQVADVTCQSIATAHRHIQRLYRAGVIQKRGHGEYLLMSAVKDDQSVRELPGEQ